MKDLQTKKITRLDCTGIIIHIFIKYLITNFLIEYHINNKTNSFNYSVIILLCYKL